MSNDASPNAPPYRLAHLAGSVVLGWLAMALCVVLSCALKESHYWSDKSMGWNNGMFMGMLLSFFLSIVTVPTAIGLWALCVWRRWNTRRIWIILIPFMVVVAPTAWRLCSPATYTAPPIAQHFEEITQAPLPASAKNVKAYFFGGGFADRSDRFYFECSAQDTEQLIKTWGLVERTSDSWSSQNTLYGSDWPNPFQWEGKRCYEDQNMNRRPFKNAFFTLITNADKTKVFIFFHTI